MKEVTCGNCKYLRFGDMMGLRTAFCAHGGNDSDGPIVPHKSKLKNGKRGGNTIITMWRIPEWCERPDIEVLKSTEMARESEWVTKEI